ncbi:hypothetical protein T07_96 [Trichinella nelsoni]|uniref:ShKT domain-containing protein n=1 Tax=Trichinella nelsoni TaxID=6336 RepID=A0A0V0RUJ8_9BILA|nr:hypothetical protein T07_96 [Trichinella nelsoni]
MPFHHLFSSALSLLILCNIGLHLQAVRNDPELWSYHKPQLNKVEPTFDSQHENNTSTTNLQSSPDRLHPRAVEDEISAENQPEDITTTTTTIISGGQATMNVLPADVETSENETNSNESNQHQPIPPEHFQDENSSSPTELSQSEDFEEENNEEELNGFHPVLTVGSGISDSFSSQGGKQDEFLRIDSSAPALESEAASLDDDSQLESSTPTDNEEQSTDETFVVVEGSTSSTFDNVEPYASESSTSLEPLTDGSGNFETEPYVESSGNVELLTDDGSGSYTIVDGSGDSSQILEGSADESADFELIDSDTNVSASAEMENNSSEENHNTAESNVDDYDYENGETTQNPNTEVETDEDEENLHSTSEERFEQPEQSTDMRQESEEIYTTTDEAEEMTETMNEDKTENPTKSSVTLNRQPEPNTTEESEASSSEEPEENDETLAKNKQQTESQAKFTKPPPTNRIIISNEKINFPPSTEQTAENNNDSSILKQPSQRGMMSFASIFRPTAFLHSSSKKSRRKMNWPEILQQLGFFNGFYRKQQKKESRVKININSRERGISSEKLKTVTVHSNLEKQEKIEEFQSTQSFLTTESTTPIESISPEALEMQRITMQEVMDDFFQSGMLEWHNQTKGIFNGKMYTHCGEELHPINIIYRMLKRKGIFDEYQQSKCHVDYHIHCKYSWKYCDSMEALTFCPKTCKQHICDKLKLYGYDGSETPTYRSSCQDTKQHDCKELSERGDCFTNPGSMALLCPESCQFCSFDEMYLPFMPEAEKLAIWLKMYKNGTYNAYSEYMTSRIKAIHNKAKQGLC